MRKKLTNTVIAKLAVPAGKASVKLFDTDVGGLGVRKMASGVATFIFEMRPKGAGAMKQVKIGRCGDISVDNEERWEARAPYKFIYFSRRHLNYVHAVEQTQAFNASCEKS